MAQTKEESDSDSDIGAAELEVEGKTALVPDSVFFHSAYALGDTKPITIFQRYPNATKGRRLQDHLRRVLSIKKVGGKKTKRVKFSWYLADGRRRFVRHKRNNRNHKGLRKKLGVGVRTMGVLKEIRGCVQAIPTDITDVMNSQLEMTASATLFETVYDEHEKDPNNEVINYSMRQKVEGVTLWEPALTNDIIDHIVDEGNSLNKLSAETTWLEHYNKLPEISAAVRRQNADEKKQKQIIEGQTSEPTGETEDGEANAAVVSCAKQPKKSFAGYETKVFEIVCRLFPDRFLTMDDFKHSRFFQNSFAKEGAWEAITDWCEEWAEFDRSDVTNHSLIPVHTPLAEILMAKFPEHKWLIVELLKYTVPSTDPQVTWAIKDSATSIRVCKQLAHTVEGSKLLADNKKARDKQFHSRKFQAAMEVKRRREDEKQARKPADKRKAKARAKTKQESKRRSRVPDKAKVEKLEAEYVEKQMADEPNFVDHKDGRPVAWIDVVASCSSHGTDAVDPEDVKSEVMMHGVHLIFKHVIFGEVPLGTLACPLSELKPNKSITKTCKFVRDYVKAAHQDVLPEGAPAEEGSDASHCDDESEQSQPEGDGVGHGRSAEPAVGQPLVDDLMQAVLEAAGAVTSSGDESSHTLINKWLKKAAATLDNHPPCEQGDIAKVHIAYIQTTAAIYRRKSELPNMFLSACSKDEVHAATLAFFDEYFGWILPLIQERLDYACIRVAIKVHTLITSENVDLAALQAGNPDLISILEVFGKQTKMLEEFCKVRVKHMVLYLKETGAILRQEQGGKHGGAIKSRLDKLVCMLEFCEDEVASVEVDVSGSALQSFWLHTAQRAESLGDVVRVKSEDFWRQRLRTLHSVHMGHSMTKLVSAVKELANAGNDSEELRTILTNTAPSQKARFVDFIVARKLDSEKATHQAAYDKWQDRLQDLVANFCTEDSAKADAEPEAGLVPFKPASLEDRTADGFCKWTAALGGLGALQPTRLNATLATASALMLSVGLADMFMKRPDVGEHLLLVKLARSNDDPEADAAQLPPLKRMRLYISSPSLPAPADSANADEPPEAPIKLHLLDTSGVVAVPADVDDIALRSPHWPLGECAGMMYKFLQRLPSASDLQALTVNPAWLVRSIDTTVDKHEVPTMRIANIYYDLPQDGPLAHHMMPLKQVCARSLELDCIGATDANGYFELTRPPTAEERLFQRMRRQEAARRNEVKRLAIGAQDSESLSLQDLKTLSG